MTLVPDGSDDWRKGNWVTTAWITPRQYALECENMVADGVSDPNICDAPGKKPDGGLDFSRLDQVLDLREQAGMARGVLEVTAWAGRRGNSQVYSAGVEAIACTPTTCPERAGTTPSAGVLSRAAQSRRLGPGRMRASMKVRSNRVPPREVMKTASLEEPHWLSWQTRARPSAGGRAGLSGRNRFGREM